jgi:hypothetical protein
MHYNQGITMFGKRFTFVVSVYSDRTKLHYGIGNRCDDGQYVPFLDYDESPLEWVYDEIGLLQEKYALGSAYVFRTKHGYHVMFLDKVTLAVLMELLDCTTVDKRFRKIPLQYARKIWVLRQSNKKGEVIEYLGVVKNERDTFHRLSRAHALFLREYSGVPSSDVRIETDGRYDETENIIIGYYKIGERGNPNA